MLKKLCKCGTSIDANLKQCDECKAKYNLNYDKYYRSNASIYKSNRWKKLTKMCKAKYHGIDVYALMKYNKLIAGRLSHHIVEVDEDAGMIYDLDNLIYVSDRSHQEIHQRYNNNKEEMQEELREFKKRFEAGGYL